MVKDDSNTGSRDLKESDKKEKTTARYKDFIDNRAKKYPLLDMTIKYILATYTEEPQLSWVVASALFFVSWLSCISNQAKRKPDSLEFTDTPLNLFFVCIGKTGQGKTTVKNPLDHLINIAANKIKLHCIVDGKENHHLTSKDDCNESSSEKKTKKQKIIKLSDPIDGGLEANAFPSSVQGMQRTFYEIPVKCYSEDETQGALATSNQFSKEVMAKIRELFNPLKFKETATKRRENNNRQTESNCIAGIILFGIESGIIKELMKEHYVKYGTTNRMIIVPPDSERATKSWDSGISCSQIAKDIEKEIESFCRENVCLERVKEIEEVLDKTETKVEVTRYKRKILKRQYNELFAEKAREVHFSTNIELNKSDANNEDIKLENQQKTRFAEIILRKAYSLELCANIDVTSEEIYGDSDLLLNLFYDTCIETGVFEQKFDADTPEGRVISVLDKHRQKNTISINLSTLTRPRGDLCKVRYPQAYMKIDQVLNKGKQDGSIRLEKTTKGGDIIFFIDNEEKARLKEEELKAKSIASIQRKSTPKPQFINETSTKREEVYNPVVITKKESSPEFEV